ncbi:MAG: mechanosensitive ion channel family protein [Enhygromyxa sp.]
MRRRAVLLVVVAGLIACLVTGLVTTASAGPPPEAPPAPAEPIDLEVSPERDAAIERRLALIYAELSSLAEVEVEVEAGVVRLRGQALDRQAGDEAEAIARRVAGVVTVDNQIEQVRALERRLQPLLERLRERGVDALLFLPLLLVGALIVVGFWLLARLLARLAERRRKLISNLFVRELVGQIVRTAVVVLGIVLALELLGASTLIGAVLGTAGLVGLALGFALRDVVENYVASLLLSIRRPFEPNDWVELADHSGRVVRLTSRATVLRTLDGNHVRIPNATVFKGTIINYTRNPQRRFSFEVGVAVEADLTRVEALACETLTATPGVLPEPAPTCFVQRFGDSAMIVSIGGWMNQQEAGWFKVNSEVRRRIKVAFECAGIDVPEPIYRVHTRALEREGREPHPSGEALERAADVSPEDYIDPQVAEERRERGDLLSSEAPIE